MKFGKKLLIIILLLGSAIAYASDYDYQERKIEGHVIHVVTINPNKYNMQIVKAQGTRETVPVIAKRANAKIAINGGFFDMGTNRDGMPTGSLVIQGQPYKVKNQIQALAIIHSGIFNIQLVNTKEYVKKNKGLNYSLVSGIPLLINHGQIVPSLFSKKSDFYAKPHARTAIGIRSDGMIVLCIAEHPYKRDLTNITMGEIPSLLAQLRNGIGLTIIELAHFMKKLDCEFAINLDGGGSATLWLDGKVKNHTIRDDDEARGVQMMRPVSDAIIFNDKV